MGMYRATVTPNFITLPQYNHVHAHDMHPLSHFFLHALRIHLRQNRLPHHKRRKEITKKSIRTSKYRKSPVNVQYRNNGDGNKLYSCH